MYRQILFILHSPIIVFNTAEAQNTFVKMSAIIVVLVVVSLKVDCATDWSQRSSLVRPDKLVIKGVFPQQMYRIALDVPLNDKSLALL